MGATNVYRTVGPLPGVIVGVLDFAKGFGAVAAAIVLMPGQEGWVRVLAGLAAIAGHNWPVWLGFKGGKGVITSAGVFLCLAWLPLVAAVTAWLIAFEFSGYVSLGSIASGITIAIAVFLFPGSWSDPSVRAAAVAAGTLIVLRHRTNIRKLLDGTEYRFDSHGRRLIRWLRA
jgi:glycerol-3-phosphate acyltransferase PlsY